MLTKESKKAESGFYTLCLIIRATIGKVGSQEGLGLALSIARHFLLLHTHTSLPIFILSQHVRKENKKNENFSDMREPVTGIEK